MSKQTTVRFDMRMFIQGNSGRTLFPRARPDHEEKLTVWLVQRADPLARHQELIALTRGEQKKLYTVSGWRPTGPVDGVLAAGGFTASVAPGTQAAPMPDATSVIRIMGFELPVPADAAAIERAIQKAMEGGLGGFDELEMGQAGWHNCRCAFQEAWKAAGCPGILVAHPGWSGAATEGAPVPILHGVAGNKSFAADHAARRLGPLHGALPDGFESTPVVPGHLIPALFPPLGGEELEALLSRHEGA